MKPVIILLLGVILLSCQKAQRDEDNSVNTCVDISLAQTIFGDAYKQIRIVAKDMVGFGGEDTSLNTIYGCESISSDTVSYPKTIVIDYKFLGCMGMEVDRYGRIIAEFFGDFGVEGSAIDITFLNYFYKEFEISGKIRVIWKDSDAQEREVHTLYVQSGSVYDGAVTMSWTSSQTWTIDSIPGLEEFIISGNSNGVNRKGNTFKSEILSTNTMREDCLYVVSGTMEIEDKNLSLRRVDYGSGSCDKKAIATINGATYDVVIP